MGSHRGFPGWGRVFLMSCGVLPSPLPTALPTARAGSHQHAYAQNTTPKCHVRRYSNMYTHSHRHRLQLQRRVARIPRQMPSRISRIQVSRGRL